MDYRPSLGAQRPRPPQRAVSSGGSYGGQPLPKRPPLPSRLSTVRSVSQPVNLVDLGADGMQVAESTQNVLGAGGAEEMVKSPEMIDVEDDDVEQPPAKRVKTSGEEFQTALEDAPVDDVDMVHEVMPGAALPSLPRARPSAGRVGAYRRNRFGIEPSARKAHGLDPPTVATRVPPPKKVLDFSPWNGSHHEDVLNENIIRNGYFDKVAGTSQSETNTAKASIWPSLSQKNHAGLSALSYMYVAVMEKRQTLGKCTAPSTFKPPPRLAVQEAKRAKWLEDLADASVSLRRLSKTIPHGIKGKLLMEQCLGKYIPLHRAMWLVRGVGMHELRAFRRKGFNEAQAASGEIKWVREWTVNVTQFLEDVMAACGQPEWQKKMDYAVKLATALYAERLLDLDYYLDWIVSSLAASTIERLPVWIIITQIHWKDLTMFGRRGRKLAAAMLEHLSVLTSTASPTGTALRASLHKLLTVLAVSNRGCLILPRTWQKYSDLLSPPGSPSGPSMVDVTRRNERLAAPLSKTPKNTRSAYLDLYDTLDSVGFDLDIVTVTNRCLQHIPEPSRLVPALLDWASTRFRIGTSRVYLAAAVIARVQQGGHDTDTIILQYLAELNSSTDTASEDHVHRVVVELVRLQAFSVGRYLQWLIASGALYSEQRTSATSLIAALPSNGLPKHVLNTRKMLMDRLGYAPDEGQAVQTAMEDFEQYLASQDAGAKQHSLAPAMLSQSAAFSYAKKLVEKVSHLAKDGELTLLQFSAARRLIERIGDISSLAALVFITASSEAGPVLATAADTVSYHASSLAALGQLSPLIERLAEQYLNLRPNQPLDRSFILALSGLAKRIPGKAALVKLLSDDLILCEQQTTLAACSPASDSVIDMHATKLESDEDIDAVFASGNVMDEQLMQRVFARIVQRASRPTVNVSKVSAWLDQLRLVDTGNLLEPMVDHYLQSMVGGGTTVSMAAVVGLALRGCASLGKIATTITNVRDPSIAQSVLSIFVSSVDSLDLEAADAYRFKVMQDRWQAEHAAELIKLLRTSMQSETFDEKGLAAVDFVVRCGASQAELLTELLSGTADDTARKNLGRLLSGILGASSGQTLDVGNIIATATPLSIRFSTAAHSLTAKAPSDMSATKDAVLQAFERRSEVWPQLLSMAGDDTVLALQQKAQGILLASSADDEQSDEQANIDRTLDLLAITSNMTQKPDWVFVGVIVDRLRDIEKQLTDAGDQGQASTARTKALLNKLSLLLRLATISVYALDNGGEAVQQTSANLLQALCALLIKPDLQLHRTAIQHIFDLASVLSDSLAESTLAALKSKLPTDPRLNFILGATFNTTDPWLALATHVPPAGAGVTQQQRALNKHQAQQLQPQKSGSGAPRAGGLPASSSTPAAQRGWLAAGGGNARVSAAAATEVKTTPYHLRRWEIISDPASTVGENDTALSLGLFGMRKV